EDIDVILNIDEPDDKDKEFEVLQKIYDNQKEWDEKLRKFAAEALTEDANDWRADDDNKEITEEEFANRIEMCGITIYSGGDFEAFYTDGDMFGEHSITIGANISGEIEIAAVAG
ncbi:MAG: DUF2262 domain-containing protein, partial [Ruminococcus sp.]|nr:DUF2262 domain-containing protein [Ruminococcus sp.]